MIAVRHYAKCIMFTLTRIIHFIFILTYNYIGTTVQACTSDFYKTILYNIKLNNCISY